MGRLSSDIAIEVKTRMLLYGKGVRALEGDDFVRRKDIQLTLTAERKDKGSAGSAILFEDKGFFSSVRSNAF